MVAMPCPCSIGNDIYSPQLSMGKVSMLKTLRSNVTKLKAECTFSLGGHSPPIPQTILDAMAVIVHLGERYL